MNDNTSSKRPLFIVLSITSLIATLAIAGYFYWQQPKAVEPNAVEHNVTAPTPATKKPIPVAVVNTIKIPSTAEVLTTLFGVKTTADKVANAADQLSSLWFNQFFAQNQDKFQVVFIKTQNIDPESKHVEDSHASEANISAVVYKQSGEQWQFFSKQINIGSFGSWGDVPEIKQVPTLQLSPDNLAFLIEDGSTGQGYTETGDGLFVFNAKTKTWKYLGFVQTGGDNAGACDDKPQPADIMLFACWRFTGEVTLSKAGKYPEYPNLFVTHKGTTSDDNNKVIPVSNRLYIFDGEQYVEEGAEAR